MIIKPAKPASGFAIRNAFQYAGIEVLGDQRYTKSHELRRGEMHFDFSDGTESPTISAALGDSVRISNAKEKTMRFSLVPLRDEALYEQFEILADGVGREFELDRLAEFKNELGEFASLMNRRLSMWGNEPSNSED